MKVKWLGIAIALTVLVTRAYARSPILFGVDIATQGGGDSTLLQIDPSTGNAMAIGPIVWNGENIRTVEALAWEPTTSTLYAGSSWLNSPYPGWLWTVDVDSGAATPVGQATLPQNPHGGTNGGYEALDFSPTGILYASSGPDLWSVNPQNGAATLVGSFGGFFVEGMSFNDAGTLWGTADPTGFAGSDTLIVIDTATASLTVIGRVVSADDSLDGFDILADGTFIAAAAVPTRLLSIDHQTGSSSPIGPLNYPLVAGLQEIPEPATLSLLVLGGLALIRRRK